MSSLNLIADAYERDLSSGGMDTDTGSSCSDDNGLLLLGDDFDDDAPISMYGKKGKRKRKEGQP